MSSLQHQEDSRPGITTLKRGNLKRLVTNKTSPAESQVIIEEEEEEESFNLVLDDTNTEEEEEEEEEEEVEPLRRRRPNMVISFDNFDEEILPTPPPAPTSSIRLSSLPAIPDEFGSVFSQGRLEDTILEEEEMRQAVEVNRMTNPFDDDGEEPFPNPFDVDMDILPPPPPLPSL